MKFKSQYYKNQKSRKHLDEALTLKPRGGMLAQPITPVNQPIPPKANIEPAINKMEKEVDKINTKTKTAYKGSSPHKAVPGITQKDGQSFSKFTYKNMEMRIRTAYNTKGPLLIFGDPGVGKSAIIKSSAKNLTPENRTYVFFNDLKGDQVYKVLNEPKKYFVLIDLRASQMDPISIMGLPDLGRSDKYLHTIKDLWIILMATEGSSGILFLDELNRVENQSVFNALMQVVLEKRVFDQKFSPDWGIIAAGNLGDGGTQPLSDALLNRFSSGILEADPDDWMKWASKEGIDERIIGFVHFDPEHNFYVKPVAGAQTPFATPRAMEKLSGEIKDLEKQAENNIAKTGEPGFDIYEAIADAAVSTCGSEWGLKFSAYVQQYGLFNWEDIVKNAPKIMENKHETLMPLIIYIKSIVKELLTKDPALQNASNKKMMEDFATLFVHLDLENATNLYKYIQWEDPKLIKQLTALLKNEVSDGKHPHSQQLLARMHDLAQTYMAIA